MMTKTHDETGTILYLLPVEDRGSADPYVEWRSRDGKIRERATDEEVQQWMSDQDFGDTITDKH
ncbi:hypothetical protein [Microbacterium terrisoli]|uniref:hypothetical protein n=1 Tax=Microbacterium terrisoli TaxID=3242192 RepID=UPI002805AF0A|nr:hypothetical protein [Microbacterium protaetiae]